MHAITKSHLLLLHYYCNNTIGMYLFQLLIFQYFSMLSSHLSSKLHKPMLGIMALDKAYFENIHVSNVTVEVLATTNLCMENIL